MKQRIYSLRERQLPDLEKLIKDYDLHSSFSGNVFIEGADPIIKSPHRLGSAVSTLLAFQAAAAAAIWNCRTGQQSDISLNILDAIHFLHPTHFIWQSGHHIHLGAENVPTNGIYPTKDGRNVMIEAGPPYPKLMNGYLNFFDCGNNRESLGKAIAKYDAEDLQEKLSNFGLPCSIAYTKDEWRNSSQGKHLVNTPAIEIEKIADSPPVEFSPNPTYPLSNIRVIDFTHVLAGPRSTRTLAEFGAEVLHISSPYERDTLAQNFAVNFGKRSAYLNLHQKNDQHTLKGLVDSGDVFALSYRPTVADRFSINPTTLAKNHPRGLIYLSVNAYGHHGPWKNRPGFDQNAQVATGFSIEEGSLSKPKYSPVFYLNDLIAAYFAAAGTMIALIRRSKEGGSYHVKVSLAKSAMWVQDLGMIEKEQYSSCPSEDTYPAKLMTTMTSYGEIKQLAPAVQFSNMPRPNLELMRPFGSDSPTWESKT